MVTKLIFFSLFILKKSQLGSAMDIYVLVQKRLSLNNLISLSSSSTSGLGVLTSNTQTPEVSDTTMSSDFL